MVGYPQYDVTHQLIMLKGFTAAELESILALADSHETTSRRQDYGKNLDHVPIHPLYDRTNWQHELPRHLAKYPFGDGNEYWEACYSSRRNVLTDAYHVTQAKNDA